VPPMVKWATAIIAGGGIAGLTQSVTTLVRAKSTVMTGTLANPAVATAELGGSWRHCLRRSSSSCCYGWRFAGSGRSLANRARRDSKARRYLEAGRHRSGGSPRSSPDRRSARGNGRDAAWILLAVMAGAGPGSRSGCRRQLHREFRRPVWLERRRGRRLEHADAVSALGPRLM
jgi:hypothetical protein